MQKKLNQKQATQKNFEETQQELGFVFVDVHKKVIQKWVNRCQAALKTFEQRNSQEGSGEVTIESQDWQTKFETFLVASEKNLVS